MTTALLSDTRPFNQAAANEVAEKALSAISAERTSPIGLILSVRAPDNEYVEAVESCLAELDDLARTVHTNVEPFDTFVDHHTGEIRIKASPNFCLLIVQENELFWAVKLDDSRR